MKVLILLLLIISACYCAYEFSDRPRNFSVELVYHAQKENYGHPPIASFGIWTLLTTVANGATGKSIKQLLGACRLPMNSRILWGNYAKLTKTVLKPTPYTGVILGSNNSVYFNNYVQILPRFRKTMTFLNTPLRVRIEKNDRERGIKRGEDSVGVQNNAATKMILENVFYFKGLWTKSFDESETKLEPFYDENFVQIGRVNMMHQISEFSFTNIEPLKAFALQLPFGIDKRYTMLFLLPYAQVKAIDAYSKLTDTCIKDIFKQMDGEDKLFGLQKIHVQIPQFRINYYMNITQPLKDMGVTEIFDQHVTDFKNISPENVYVDRVIQKVQIQMTESGIMAPETNRFGIIANIQSFQANKPFIYFLVEKSTNSLIFGGIYSV